MKLKKILATVMATIAAVATFSFAGCGGKGSDKETLYVYTNAGFAPYEYLNDRGDVVGVDIDIMNYIGEQLGYNVVVNDIDFDQILLEVEKDKMAVGAAGMTKKASRDEVALASISYATSVQYVIVPVDTFDAEDLTDGKLPLSKLNELSNKTIGVQEGTTGEFMLDDATAPADEENEIPAGELFGAEKIAYKNAIVASQDIGTTLGAVIIDKLPAQEISNANSDLECFELDAEPESYVLYFNKEATELVADVNVILAQMIADGTIDQYTINHSSGNN
ncbi:MAG: amino acid ABC transporter substrate-binding protein [Clostridia bacterium]|nr:amino acid ABC transporter substrate-binding protein [Clostridia bacterium]